MWYRIISQQQVMIHHSIAHCLCWGMHIVVLTGPTGSNSVCFRLKTLLDKSLPVPGSYVEMLSTWYILLFLWLMSVVTWFCLGLWHKSKEDWVSVKPCLSIRATGGVQVWLVSFQQPARFTSPQDPSHKLDVKFIKIKKKTLFALQTSTSCAASVIPCWGN